MVLVIDFKDLLNFWLKFSVLVIAYVHESVKVDYWATFVWNFNHTKTNVTGNKKNYAQSLY